MLESYMTEQFINNAFKLCGESPSRVKLMRNQHTGEQAGYCFVHFDTEDLARNALHKLNGKVIPNTSPAVRFKLNYAGINSKPGSVTDNEYPIFVGDLSADVDDYALFKLFSSRYNSTRTAKVVIDSNGYSKGYAFIRFASEADQKKCIAEMNGYVGLGTKPLKIGTAAPRPAWKKTENNQSSSNTVIPTTYDYTQPYYDSAAWQTYSWQSNYYHQQAMIKSMRAYYQQGTFEGEDDMELIEHTAALNVDEQNQAAMSRDLDFWDSIENSKWSPIEAI